METAEATGTTTEAATIPAAVTTYRPASIPIAAPSVAVPTPIPVAAPISIRAVTEAAAIAVPAAQPGSCPYKEPTIEPCWPVVPIWSAGIRSIAEVPKLADRRPVNVSRRTINIRYANPDAHRNLGMRVSRRKHQHQKQSEIT